MLELEEEKSRLLDHLSQSYSQDRISLEEYERLVESITVVRTRGELEALTHSLVPKDSRQRLHPAASGSRRSAPSSSLAVFSGSEIKGRFLAPSTHKSLALFGGVAIDLREAEIPEDGMDLHALALFGGIDIIVPRTVNVVCHGMGIFGAFSSRNNESHIPGAPTVRIRGLGLFGGVEVKVR